jgi:WD40 repeat protein
VWVVDFPEMAMAISDGHMQTVLGKYPKEDQILAPCHILLGHESAISCVAISSELGITISGSIRGKICVHTLRTGEFIRSFSPSANHDVPVTKIVLEEHGRMVIVMGDRRLYTYTVNGTCLCSVDAEEQIHDMKITGEVVVTGGENGHVYIRNLATLKILSGLNLSKHGTCQCTVILYFYFAFILYRPCSSLVCYTCYYVLYFCFALLCLNRSYSLYKFYSSES